MFNEMRRYSGGEEEENMLNEANELQYNNHKERYRGMGNRRDRIAECLDELKELMMYSLGVEGESSNKLEKADILEVTVKYLRRLKETDCLALTPNLTYSTRFRQGFNTCTNQVANYLNQPTSGVDRQAAVAVFAQMSSNMKALETLALVKQTQLKQTQLKAEKQHLTSPGPMSMPVFPQSIPIPAVSSTSPSLPSSSGLVQTARNHDSFDSSRPSSCSSAAVPLDLSCSTGSSWRPW